MISHHNVVSNVLQVRIFDKPNRDARPENERTEVGLGLLPLSHIYGLVVIAQASMYRGDEVIILLCDQNDRVGVFLWSVICVSRKVANLSFVQGREAEVHAPAHGEPELLEVVSVADGGVGAIAFTEQFDPYVVGDAIAALGGMDDLAVYVTASGIRDYQRPLQLLCLDDLHRRFGLSV